MKTSAPFGFAPVKQEGMPLWGDPMGTDGYMAHENGVYSIHIMARRLSEEDHRKLVAALTAEVTKVLYGDDDHLNGLITDIPPSEMPEINLKPRR